jgi:hypothetical protein
VAESGEKKLESCSATAYIKIAESSNDDYQGRAEMLSALRELVIMRVFWGLNGPLRNCGRFADDLREKIWGRRI